MMLSDASNPCKGSCNTSNGTCCNSPPTDGKITPAPVTTAISHVSVKHSAEQGASCAATYDWTWTPSQAVANSTGPGRHTLYQFEQKVEDPGAPLPQDGVCTFTLDVAPDPVSPALVGGFAVGTWTITLSGHGAVIAVCVRVSAQRRQLGWFSRWQ